MQKVQTKGGIRPFDGDADVHYVVRGFRSVKSVLGLADLGRPDV